MPAKLIIKKLDSPVAPSPGRWLSGETVANVEVAKPLGNGEEVAGGSFVHYIVTDQTPAQMEYVLQTWNRDLVIVNTTPSQPGGLRSISITNSLVNASGDMGEWTTVITADILTQWNGGNPSLTLTDDGIISPSVWNATVVLPTEADEIAFDDFITDYGLSSMVKRKVFYITPAGMANIDSAGGSQSGTSSQLSGILRDGTLD